MVLSCQPLPGWEDGTFLDFFLIFLNFFGSETGNGTLTQASTWMGQCFFVGIFHFFKFILSWQIVNGTFVRSSTWMGRWMELEGHMNSSREIDVGLFSGTPCLCNRRSLANNKLLLKTIQKWHWASTKHYEELHANFTRWNTALLNLYQKWVSGSPHVYAVKSHHQCNQAGSPMWPWMI